MTQPSDGGNAGGFAGWRIVALASFIHNCSYGIIFGAYGVSVVQIEARYGVSRTLAAAMLSLMIGATIFSAPLLGALYGRLSIRRSMMLGTVLAAVGHFVLAANDDWRVMIAAYALLMGPGVALTSSMPTNVLVTNWFTSSQGKAFGIVNLPIGMMVVPMLAAIVLERYGLAALYVGSGIALLSIIPAAWYVVDRPRDLGQAPLGGERTAVLGAGLHEAPPSLLGLARRFDFWVIAVAIGIIVGGGAMKQAHLVPLLTEQGHSLQFASSLLALASGAGAIGSMVLGWLADRFGGLSVLLGNAIVQALMWFVFLLPVGAPVLVVDAIVIGTCAGGVSAAQGVLICRYFGTAHFGRALGMIGLAAAPFLLGINTIAGAMHDRTGDYRLAVLSLIAATAGAAVALVLLWRRQVAADDGGAARSA